MSHRASDDPIKATVSEAPAVASSVKKVAASLELLDGDEIIQLSIRPSLWCVPLSAFKLVLAMALLAAAIGFASRGQPSLAASIALVVVLLVAASGILAATLQWASRLYVLTNRRVLHFRGVFSVDVTQCGLTQVAEARPIRVGWYEPLLRLGSIGMTPIDPHRPGMTWEHLARPAEVHEILVKAIQKARAGR